MIDMCVAAGFEPIVTTTGQVVALILILTPDPNPNPNPDPNPDP
jgi:hypothetical protein